MTTSTTKPRKGFALTGKPSEVKNELLAKPKAEEPMKAVAPEQNLAPSPYDLTTLQNVKDFLEMQGDTDDNLLQGMITAFSVGFLWQTGFNNQDGTLSSGSPFNSPQSYSEVYDGNGSFRMFLRVYPIVSVTQLMINGVVIPQSTGTWGAPGFLIDGTRKSLSFQTGGGGGAQSFTFPGYPALGSNRWFVKGVQNISVQYEAGYPVTPFDIEECAKKVVAQNYKRRDWIDQKSQAMAQGMGTTTLRDWKMPPECVAVISRYQRTAMV